MNGSNKSEIKENVSFFPNEISSGAKGDKMDKIRGYSDYCQWLFHSNVSFGLIFTVLYIQLSSLVGSLLPLKQDYIVPQTYIWAIFNVTSDSRLLLCF